MEIFTTRLSFNASKLLGIFHCGRPVYIYCMQCTRFALHSNCHKQVNSVMVLRHCAELRPVNTHWMKWRRGENNNNNSSNNSSSISSTSSKHMNEPEPNREKKSVGKKTHLLNSLSFSHCEKCDARFSNAYFGMGHCSFSRNDRSVCANCFDSLAIGTQHTVINVISSSKRTIPSHRSIHDEHDGTVIEFHRK